MIFGNLETLERLYNLTNLFQDFTIRIKSHILTGFYRVFWKVLPAIKLLVVEYKKYDLYYTTPVLNNKILEIKREEPDIKYSYILLFVKNTLSKLIKYHEFLS